MSFLHLTVTCNPYKAHANVHHLHRWENKGWWTSKRHRRKGQVTIKIWGCHRPHCHLALLHSLQHTAQGSYQEINNIHIFSLESTLYRIYFTHLQFTREALLLEEKKNPCKQSYNLHSELIANGILQILIQWALIALCWWLSSFFPDSQSWFYVLQP